MSFFGFDTALPRDKGPIEGKRDDPFDPTDEQDQDDDAAFEEKLRGLTAGAQEDVEIYTWGGGGEGGYDGLGDLLEEAGDDLNNDTFGFGGQEVGKDFDFSGTGGSSTFSTSTKTSGKKAKTNDAAFASTLDDFWFTPQVASTKTITPQPSIPAPAIQMQQQQQRPSAPRTMEEIEAELRASHQQKQQPAVPVSSSPAGRHLTLEEVEAEMLARRSQPPMLSSAIQPELSNLMKSSSLEQEPQQTPPSILAGATFPPLGSQTPPRTQAVAPAPISSDPQSQQAHFDRMRALLEALPPPLQGRILALPPFMQFGAVESIAREFPALTVAGRVEKLPQQIENPKLWPRADGSAEEVNAIRSLIEAAFGHIEEAEQMERKLQVRLAKINAMSRYNNLMTLSDKDFITRIQVSQLVTSDPYSDDFYAHIFFALRGNGQTGAATNPGLMGKKPLTSEQQSESTPTTKAGRTKKQQPSRRETAMIRMQQQVERIVQNRKERVEKSTQGAALEGALGRISLSNTKTPRQMLQVDAVKEEVVKPATEVGTGHAQDAVRQALKGASLGNDEVGFQKRPPLSKLEVLSILESLYDMVLSLEQSRRNAPANANDGNEGEAVEWRQNRDELISKLWTELRVLEPLEISDPHPFVSLLSTVKGKRLLPRVLRHLSSEQTLTAMTMIVASFDTLDVVKDSILLDEAISIKSRGGAKAEKRSDVQRQTEAFATSIVPSMLTLMTTAPMQIVSGMLALFIERNDPIRVAQSKAGIAFLTIFLSRAETLRQQVTDGPTANEISQWSEIFNLLTQRLTSTQLSSLFPSTRAKATLPFGTNIELNRKNQLELEDQAVWQLMAALAVSADMNQQQIIVTGLREKILENVLEAKQWRANNLNSSSDEGDIRIRNVNLLLHALNLDAAQITV